MGLVNIYPPLYEKDKNGIVAQFEETVFIDEHCVKILSKEWDQSKFGKKDLKIPIMFAVGFL